MVVPHLYDLKPDGTGVLALQGVGGPMIVLSWLFDRAARWTLDRYGIRGAAGLSLLKGDEEEDEEFEEDEEDEEEFEDEDFDDEEWEEVDDDEDFVVPHVLAAAPTVVVSEWLEGYPLSRVIAEGSPSQVLDAPEVVSFSKSPLSKF